MRALNFGEISLVEVDRHSLPTVVQAEERHAKAASDRDAQEAAQCKVDRAMNEAVKAQDRLVRALQTELDMTNRAREAAQVPKWGEDEGVKRSFPFICMRLSQEFMHFGESV